MKKAPKPTKEETAMHLHDMSVSGKPHVEAAARALKAMGEICLDWCNAEFERGTEPAVIIQAMIKSHVAVAHAVGRSISNRDEVEMIKVIGEAYRVAFVSFAAHVEEYKQQRKKAR